MSRLAPTFRPNVQRAWRFVTPLVAAFLLVAVPRAGAAAYLPPSGQVFAGVTDKPVSAYVAAVGKHPAVYQEFVAWGQYLPGITQDALNAHARLMMAIGTGYGTREAITPAGIAAGDGDGWLIGVNQAIFDSHNITYVRLMAEMDGYWNFYSAFNADGSARNRAHSAAQYRRAWKRVTLILRGGPVAGIDAQLGRLGMPPMRGVSTTQSLPRPQVAMLWVPEVAPGDPAVPGNQPGVYWPGRRWVDWVGTDFYAKFPNFAGLNAFYDSVRGVPFVFGEYALWGADDPSFVARLLSWVSAHRRVRMLVYNQGFTDGGPFKLAGYPRAARQLRRLLASSRFPAYAPEWTP